MDKIGVPKKTPGRFSSPMASFFGCVFFPNSHMLCARLLHFIARLTGCAALGYVLNQNCRLREDSLSAWQDLK